MIETIRPEQRQALKLPESGPWRSSARKIEVEFLDTPSLEEVNSSKTQITGESPTMGKPKMIGSPLRSQF